MRKLFEFSVRQPLLANLITVVILVAGVMAISGLNRDIFPNVNLDLVIVNASYPGATPQEIEKLITIPIEKELKEVSDIKEMNSASIEGLATILIEIEPDARDKAKVVNDIQRAVDNAEDLPSDLKDKPLVNELQMRDHPVVEVSLSGDIPEAVLVESAREMETRLLDLSDISRVDRNGWRDQEIWVEVDPDEVSRYNLSLAEVIHSLKSQNVSIPGGSVIGDGVERLLRTTGEFESASEIERVILRANELGHWVEVSDIAKVSDDFEPWQQIHRANGHRAINLVAVKKESADVITMVEEVKRLVDDYRRIAPEGLDMKIVNDMSVYVQRRLDVLVGNGWVGVTLVVICLFLFLSLRAGIVTAIGIPTALLITFIAMYYSRMSINMLTMFALIMVLGMLVDDAIVIAENVHRRIAGGDSVEEAAIEGSDEIWAPVLTTVLTTVVAFAPLMFMSGIIGKFVLYMPLVVIIALAASLFQAFVILPAHIVTIERLPRSKFLGRLHRGIFDRLFGRFAEGYVGLIKRLIRMRWRFIGIVSIFFAVSLYIGLFRLPFVLFPQRGIDAFFIRAKAPIGTPVERTEEMMKRIEAEVAKIPASEMDDYVTQVGVIQQDSGDPAAERASHLAQMQIFLKPEVDRKMTSDEMIARLREATEGFAEFTEITFDNVRQGPPVGKPVSVRIRGEDLDELDAIADEIKAFLAGVRGVSDIRDDYEEGKGEINVDVDERQAARADITVEDVALAVRSAFEGTIATSIKRSDEEIDVRVRFPDSWRYRPGSLDKVLIPNPQGYLIPITQVATPSEKRGINAIRHYERKRTVTVTANVDEDLATSVGTTKAIASRFADVPKEHPGVIISFGGEWEKTQESMADLKIAMIIAALLIFTILVFEFQSLLQPVVVLLAVLYGFVGVTWTFIFHAEPKSFLAMMGVVGLSGVVVNNSIVFMDFINKARKNGMSVRDSIVEAGRLRLRPILLTTITTIFGILPVAYGVMGSDPFLKPMALSLGWGLAFATACTLLVTPPLYAVVDDLHCRLISRLKFWSNGCQDRGF